MDLAETQHGVITVGQLGALGHERSDVDRLNARRHLQRLHRGVYAVGHRNLGDAGRLLAAALSVDAENAMVARLSAGHHHRLLKRHPRHGLIEVAVPSYRGGRRSDVHVLRLGSLTESDRVVVDGVPCTSVSRTLVDLAGVLNGHDLGKAIREADYRGLLDLPTIAAVIAGIARPRGVVQLRELLGCEPARHCDSRLERRVLQLILDAGLPHPVLQQRFVIGRPAEPIYVDFFWPDLRLVIEVDGPHHERPSFAARDAYRDAELSKQKIFVHRVTDRALAADPAATLQGIIAAHRLRS